MPSTGAQTPAPPCNVRRTAGADPRTARISYQSTKPAPTPAQRKTWRLPQVCREEHQVASIPEASQGQPPPVHARRAQHLYQGEGCRALNPERLTRVGPQVHAQTTHTPSHPKAPPPSPQEVHSPRLQRKHSPPAGCSAQLCRCTRAGRSRSMRSRCTTSEPQ